MSKRGQDHDVQIHRTAKLSKWKLTDPGLTLRNLHKTELGPLNVGDSCVTWAVCRATSSGTSIYP